MNETIGPTLILPGGQEPPGHIVKLWDNAIERNRVAIEEKYPLTQLPPFEEPQYAELESRIDNYFYQKLASYGVPIDEVKTLPKARYATFSTESFGNTKVTHRGKVSGVYSSRPNMISMPINIPRDIFCKMTCLAHEKSHASTPQVAYMYLDENQRYKSVTEMSGMAVIGNRSIKADLLEECFATMDLVHFTDTILKESLPSHYEEILKLIREGRYDETLSTFDTSLYGEIPESLLVPFVVIEDSDNPESFDTYLSLLIKEYLLGRAICLAVGKTLVDGKETDDESIAKTGFEMLDRSRYTRDNVAHRKIVAVFGGKKTKALFSHNGHTQDVDPIMRLLFD